MTLRVIAVPAPAAGVEWSYTVPAQWVLDVVAVQATLTTSRTPTTAVDGAAAGAYPATYQAAALNSYGQVGPYGGASNFAVTTGAGVGSPTEVAEAAATTDFNRTVFSVGCWTKLRSGFTARNPWFANSTLSGIGTLRGYIFQGSAVDNPPRVQLQWNGGAAKSAGAVPYDVWHHVAITSDGANLRFYIDGVLDTTTAAVPAFDAIANLIDLGGAGSEGLEVLFGSISGLFFHDATLTGPQIAAYVTAAATSAAAYKAAVLADGPRALWMFTEIVTHGSRVATLTVTDGTTAVANYPGGTNAGTGSTFSWTWASQAPGTSQSPDAAATLVQIPDLRLPGGYTLGTVTPDLSPQDQWGNVNIWWDDRYSVGVTAGSAREPYLSGLLVPDYSHSLRRT